MSQHSNQYPYYLFSVAILLLTAYLVVDTLTPYGAATSPDSISYLDMASNFKSTSQLAQTDFSLAHLQQPQKLIPQRSWPPAYPLALSITTSDEFDVMSVAELSMVLLFTSAFMLLMLLRAMDTHWLLALTFSCLSMLTLPLIVVFGYVWSETLFIPLLLALTLALWYYIENDSASLVFRSALMAIITALAVSLTMTRYIGIYATLLFPLTFLLVRKTLANFLLISGGMLLQLSIVAIYLWHNYQLTGSITGNQRAPSQVSPMDNIILLLASFKTLLPLSWIGYAIAAVVALGFLYVLTRAQQTEPPLTSTPNHRKFVTLISCVAALYLITLVAMRSHSQFDDIDVRLIAPAVPPLLLVLCVVPRFFSGNRIHFIAATFISLLLFFSLVARGYDCLNAASLNWAEKASPMLPMRGQQLYNNFTYPSPAESELSNSIVPPGAKLVTDRPLLWRFITGSETLQKPAEFTPTTLALLNALPAGSAILVSQPEAIALEQAAATQGWKVEHRPMGNYLVVRLPLAPQQN